MSFSHASVVETSQLNKRLVRIVLQVEDPTGLEVLPEADSAVCVYLPAVQDTEPDGRNYSVRFADGARIGLDVVLHARGPGTTWAAGAAVGDRVGLDHARSWYRPPDDIAWQLLVTDLSGLPATARIIEALPEDMPTVVLAEVVDDEDLQYLPSRPNVSVIARIGTGNGYAPSQLGAATAALELPQGRGYCWFAGEAAQSRLVRKYFRGLGWSTDQLDITGYWRYDSESWDEKFALVSDDVVAVYEKALADGRGDKVASEEFDEALERVGL